MASPSDNRQKRLVRKLVELSVENGIVDGSRVAGILEALRKDPPRQHRAVLRAYQTRLSAEIARRQAVIEHAGPLPPDTMSQVVKTLSDHYGRALEPVLKETPELIAGLRIRVGDDLYDTSVAGRLNRLGESSAA